MVRCLRGIITSNKVFHFHFLIKVARYQGKGCGLVSYCGNTTVGRKGTILVLKRKEEGEKRRMK